MKRIWWCITAFLVLFIQIPLSVCAGEADSNMLMRTQEKTRVYEERDKNSGIITELEEGTPIICTEIYEDGWYKIIYQDVEGYILQETTDNYIDQEQLDAEFADIAEENDFRLETIDMLMKQEKSEHIWGTIMLLLIGALVVGMFISGICVLRSNRGDKRRIRRR